MCCVVAWVLSFRTNKLLHRFYRCVLYSHLQNIVVHYTFGSVVYFEEKTTKNCENQKKKKKDFKGM
jgi:hypothetical protein